MVPFFVQIDVSNVETVNSKVGEVDQGSKVMNVLSEYLPFELVKVPDNFGVEY